MGSSEEKAAIEAVLQQYNAALNASSVERCLALYADDSVFMPPYSPSAVGRQAVEAAYTKVFDTITLDVVFKTEEIVALSEGWAFVRTNSAGKNTVHATGRESVEGTYLKRRRKYSKTGSGCITIRHILQRMRNRSCAGRLVCR